jgi:hypothetical protein
MIAERVLLISLKGLVAIRRFILFQRNKKKGDASTSMNNQALRCVPPISGSNSCTDDPSTIIELYCKPG